MWSVEGQEEKNTLLLWRIAGNSIMPGKEIKTMDNASFTDVIVELGKITKKKHDLFRR